jgi:hypothetical protein
MERYKAVLSACLTNRLGIEYAVDSHRLVGERPARGMAIVHSNLAGITTAVVSVRRVRIQTTVRRAGSTVVERTSCACWPLMAQATGGVGMPGDGVHPRKGSHYVVGSTRTRSISQH